MKTKLTIYFYLECMDCGNRHPIRPSLFSKNKNQDRSLDVIVEYETSKCDNCGGEVLDFREHVLEHD